MPAIGRRVDAQSGQAKHGLRQIGNRRVSQTIGREQPFAVGTYLHQRRWPRIQNVRDWLRSFLVAMEDRRFFLLRLLRMCGLPGMKSNT